MRRPNTPFGGSVEAADDETLISQAQSGKREALEELLRQHRVWIFDIATKVFEKKGGGWQVAGGRISS